jgi:transposase
MKTNIKLIKKHRQFSEAFKKQIVKDFESGRFSVPQIERLHCISNKSIYKWIYKFSTFNQQGYRIVEMKRSTTAKVKDLENRVKELEQAVGQKQIMIDYLEKMMEIAKDELGIDVKKNFNTSQSPGSGKTNRK